MVAVDPLASLAPRWIEVTLGGQDWTIAPRKAIDWLEIIIERRTLELVPGWFEEEEAFGVILDGLDDGLISEQEVENVTKEILEAASGRVWWWGVRLLGMATQDSTNWAQLHGKMLLGGVHASKVSLSAWFDALYAAQIDGMAEEQKKRFDGAIDTPPVGEMLDEEAESAAFLALMAGG